MPIEGPKRLLRYEIFPASRDKIHDSIDTLKSISNYARALGFKDRDEFIDFIQGKRVLNVSAGFDGLAIQIALDRIDTFLISNNPSRIRLTFYQERLAQLKSTLPFNQYRSSDLDSAVKIVDENATSYLAQSLGFAAELFDVVIDCYGIFYYARQGDVPQLYRATREMWRVTKPGGTILGGDISFLRDISTKGVPIIEWKEKLFIDMGIADPAVLSTSQTGFRITKPY